MKEEMDFPILGRKIGTFTGWDHADSFAIQVYGFKPLKSVDLPEIDSIIFDLRSGKAIWYDENQNEFIVDFASKIIHLPFDKEESYD